MPQLRDDLSVGCPLWPPGRHWSPRPGSESQATMVRTRSPFDAAFRLDPFILVRDGVAHRPHGKTAVAGFVGDAYPAVPSCEALAVGVPSTPDAGSRRMRPARARAEYRRGHRTRAVAERSANISVLAKKHSISSGAISTPGGPMSKTVSKRLSSVPAVAERSSRTMATYCAMTPPTRRRRVVSRHSRAIR